MKVVSAAAPKWWIGLSPEQQKEYIEEHPKSRMAKDHPLFKSAKENEGLHTSLKHPLVGVLKDQFGNTPLHYAAEYSPAARSHPQASLTKNNQGHTPADYYEKVVKKALSPGWGK